MKEYDFSQRLSPAIARFVESAMPYSHWGITYFNIRLMELALIDSLLDGAIKKGGERFLDFGCGLGLACMYASGHFSEVYGVDIDEIGEAFKTDCAPPHVGSEIIAKTAVKNVTLTAGDSFDYLRSHQNHFDMILSVFCLEHVKDINLACDLIADALKPGGRVVHIIPNTHDTANQLLVQSLQPFDKIKPHEIKVGRGPKEMGSLHAPITHSEFIDDYREQFDINSLERYLFPMMLSGLTIDKVTPMREHSYAVLASKPQRTVKAIP